MKRDVVYVTHGRWPGTLVIVTTTTVWGVSGYIPMPGHDEDAGVDMVSRAFFRVANGAFVKVGEIEIEEEQREDSRERTVEMKMNSDQEAAYQQRIDLAYRTTVAAATDAHHARRLAWLAMVIAVLSAVTCIAIVWLNR